MQAFVQPDFGGPLDLEERLEAIPSDAMNKGVLFQSVVKDVLEKTGQTVGRGKYGALSAYPVAELVEVLAGAAATIFPDQPPHEGLRRLGQRVFPRLRGTAAGTFLFSVAGDNVRAAFKLVGRAYSLFSCASATSEFLDENNIIVELRNAWTFPASYNFGIFEGALQHYQQPGELRIRIHSLCDVDLKLTLL